MTGCRHRKAGRQGGQRGSEGRSDVYHGQGETGPRNPRESEKFQQGGCQRNLDQGPSKEGPEPTTMIAHFEAGEHPDGSTNSKRSPHRGSVSDQGRDARVEGSEAMVRAQSGSHPKPQGGDSGAHRGRPTEAARLPRIEVTAARLQHRHQREEDRRSDLITSSQKVGELVGPPSSGGGPGEGDPQRTQVLEYKDKELGSVEPGSRCKGDGKEEPNRQVQGEEGPSGKGPGSKGNGRRCSGESPPGKLGTSEQKASSSEREGELLAEGAPGGNPTSTCYHATPTPGYRTLDPQQAITPSH